jgi:hypothetical protein
MSDAAAAEAKMIENLREKTGKSLDQWVAIAGRCGATTHKAIVQHLKDDHGLGHGYANLVVHKLLKSAAGDAEADDLVTAQYAGAKAGLRPIYDALVSALEKLGPDVELAPKKAYVSVRRAKQFALIQPSTATRLDLGVNLKGVAPAGRLEVSGSFNSMVSHRVRLQAPGDVDADVVAWLRAAYEAAK